VRALQFKRKEASSWRNDGISRTSPRCWLVAVAEALLYWCSIHHDLNIVTLTPDVGLLALPPLYTKSDLLLPPVDAAMTSCLMSP